MEINEMLTLSDINRLTNSHDGDIYSDLYKDVYGCRPRGTTFESIEEFDKDFDFLAKCLDRMIEEEKAEKAIRWDGFLARINEIKQLVSNADTVRAVEIIAEAEGIDKEELNFYGWESLEYRLGLQFDSIKSYLAKAA